MNSTEQCEPATTISVAGSQVTLLGTAHVSRASADKVRELLNSGEYDAVAVELCPSRHNAIVNPDAIAKMDLYKVLREGKGAMVAASLALGAFQQRVADELDIKPGAEMCAAVDVARERGFPVLLIDREIGVTLKRIYSNAPWWKRATLLVGVMFSVISQQKVSEEEIERLKDGDILESTFAQFAEKEGDLYLPLIDERDRYMVARLQQEVAAGDYQRILVVIGAGHMKGMQRYFQGAPMLDRDKAEEGAKVPPADVISELDSIPTTSQWVKMIPWLIVLLIVSGFILGFSKNSELGWQLVTDWVVINGGLAAIGALVAAAHPLTVVTAFVAAPITSLNPMVGAGMATAAMEIWLRKPSVDDFSQLRTDTAQIKGWWKNRVSRVLLVFIFSTLGSAIGTYVAGFRIFERLAG